MSLFTMEQMELIRRLRLTGITPEAVLEAFRELDQVESELEAITQLSKQHQNNQQQQQTAAQAFALAAAKLIFQGTTTTTTTNHKSETIALETNNNNNNHTNNGLISETPAMLLQQSIATTTNKLNNTINSEILNTNNQFFNINNSNNNNIGLSNMDTLEAIKAAFFGAQQLKQETISRSNSPTKPLTIASPKQRSPLDHCNSSVLTTVPLASAMASPSLDVTSSTTVGVTAATTTAFNFMNDVENGMSISKKRSFTTAMNNNSGSLNAFINNAENDHQSRLMGNNNNNHSTTPTSSALSFLNSTANQMVSPLLMQATSRPFTISSISPPPSSSSSSGSANGFLGSNTNGGSGIFNANNHFGSLLANSNSENLLTSGGGGAGHMNSGASANSSSTNGGGTCRPIRSQRTPMKDITTLDDPMELEQFMSQGEEGCINDMKQFITQFSLRQTTVAMMTGVSQPYISKLLNGNHKELSLRCRKNIYSWYLNCRRHPAKLGQFTSDPSNRLETNCDGELVPQRRERYVFRPMLIKILEAYFLESPFPDNAKRLEIAQACNQSLQLEKKGTPLMPKEMVTPQVIANWFANKRKEMRRKSNDEPLSATICGAAQQFVNSVSQSSPINNTSVFSSSMNQLVAVANAAAALAHAAANNNNNQQNNQIYSYDEDNENNIPSTRPTSSTNLSMLADECDEDYDEERQNVVENSSSMGNFQSSFANSDETTTITTYNNTTTTNTTLNNDMNSSSRKNAVEEFLESRTQLFNLPFRLELPAGTQLDTSSNPLKRPINNNNINDSVTNNNNNNNNNNNDDDNDNDNDNNGFNDKEKETENLLLNGWGNNNGNHQMNSLVNGYSLKFDNGGGIGGEATTKRAKKDENKLNQLFNQVNAQHLINASILDSCDITNDASTMDIEKSKIHDENVCRDEQQNGLISINNNNNNNQSTTVTE